ncbi:MAG: hypothetical protein HQK66_09845, partial [Desulfamplus sp.]|nr:hypothetical protein [Desulfamplus sp.]
MKKKLTGYENKKRPHKAPPLKRVRDYAGRNSEILCGIHPVMEALKAGKRIFSKFFFSKNSSSGRLGEIVRLAGIHGISTEYVSGEIMADMTGCNEHQGVAAEVTPYPFKRAENIDLED